MVFAGDGGTGEFCSRFPSYDWVQPQARAAVLADFARMRESGAVDGVYLDKSGTWPGFGDNGNSPVPQGSNTLCQHDCYTMTPSQTAAYTQGRLELFRVQCRRHHSVPVTALLLPARFLPTLSLS